MSGRRLVAELRAASASAAPEVAVRRVLERWQGQRVSIPRVDPAAITAQVLAGAIGGQGMSRADAVQALQARTGLSLSQCRRKLWQKLRERAATIGTSKLEDPPC